MIRVSILIACPIIFILFCDLIGIEEYSELWKMVRFK